MFYGIRYFHILWSKIIGIIQNKHHTRICNSEICFIYRIKIRYRLIANIQQNPFFQMIPTDVRTTNTGASDDEHELSQFSRSDVPHVDLSSHCTRPQMAHEMYEKLHQIAKTRNLTIDPKDLWIAAFTGCSLRYREIEIHNSWKIIITTFPCNQNTRCNVRCLLLAWYPNILEDRWRSMTIVLY